MDSHLPVIMIELVLVFGGVLLFGWWQLRDVKRDQEAAAAKKRAQAAHDGRAEPEPAKQPRDE